MRARTKYRRCLDFPHSCPLRSDAAPVFPICPSQTLESPPVDCAAPAGPREARVPPRHVIMGRGAGLPRGAVHGRADQLSPAVVPVGEPAAGAAAGGRDPPCRDSGQRARHRYVSVRICACLTSLFVRSVLSDVASGWSGRSGMFVLSSCIFAAHQRGHRIGRWRLGAFLGSDCAGTRRSRRARAQARTAADSSACL